MAKEIDKIIQSKTTPKSNNVLWDDGENLKINRNGKWEDTAKSVPTNFLNNNKEVGGLVNSPFGYEGGAYSEATIDATPGEWVFVLTPEMYYLGNYVINGVEVVAPKGEEEVIFNMGSYQIKIDAGYNIYVYAFYPQTITISCRTYTSKKLLSSNFVRNDVINLSTEEGVSTLKFLLDNYGYLGLRGRIFGNDNNDNFVCTDAAGADSFTNFSIMGFRGIKFYRFTISGGISYPLNITTDHKNIQLEE